AYGLDELARERLVDLRAEITDVDLHHVRERLEIVLPDRLDDARARDDFTGVLEQELQKRELPRGQPDLLPLPDHLAGCRVEREIRAGENGGCSSRCAPQDRKSTRLNSSH